MLEILEHTWDMPRDAHPAYSILRLMEQAARLHTIALEIDRPQMLERYGAIWMIVRTWLHFDQVADVTQPLTVRTWHRGVTRGLIYRDFDLLQNGVRIGEAVQTWVLVDSARRTLYRMEHVAELQGTPRPETVKTLRPRRLSPTQPLVDAPAICAGTDALDENGHINNTAYVKLLLEALPSLPDIQTLELCYHHECFAGQTLPRKQWQDQSSAYVQLMTPEGAVALDLLARAF